MSFVYSTSCLIVMQKHSVHIVHLVENIQHRSINLVINIHFHFGKKAFLTVCKYFFCSKEKERNMIYFMSETNAGNISWLTWYTDTICTICVNNLQLFCLNKRWV